MKECVNDKKSFTIRLCTLRSIYINDKKNIYIERHFFLCVSG